MWCWVLDRCRRTKNDDGEELFVEVTDRRGCETNIVKSGRSIKLNGDKSILRLVGRQSATRRME